MTWQHTAMTPTAQPATPEQTAAQQPTPPQATIKHAAPEQMAPKQATPQQTTPQQPLPVPLAQVAAPPARRETTQRTLPERMAPQAPSAPTASITLPMAPMVMQPPALNPAAPAKGDKTLAPLFSDGAPAASQPWHASAWQIGSPPDPLQAPPTDLPAATLRQIAQVLQNQPGRPVELSLNPEELGRLRLSITTTDQGVTVNILAERSETLDLLRRNIDLLGQELRQIGYDSVAFSFGGGQSAPDQDTEGSSNSSAPTPLDTPVEIALEPSAQPARIAAQSGVDIRL
ncbi:MAG: flagellar hook-length control protein FliK [Sulfitobacter sp.]